MHIDILLKSKGTSSYKADQLSEVQFSLLMITHHFINGKLLVKWDDQLEHCRTSTQNTFVGFVKHTLHGHTLCKLFEYYEESKGQISNMGEKR